MAIIDGVPRNLPRDRISAYECELGVYGKPVKKRYVTGWYEFFTEERLRSEVMPKLAECAAQGYSYPFLITSHRLEAKTVVDITLPPGRSNARASDLAFRRRRRESPQNWVALVLSPTKFELL